MGGGRLREGGWCQTCAGDPVRARDTGRGCRPDVCAGTPAGALRSLQPAPFALWLPGGAAWCLTAVTDTCICVHGTCTDAGTAGLLGD